MIFTVDEGDRVRSARSTFEGNTVFGDRRLQLAMRKTKETASSPGCPRSDIYDPAKLQEDLDKVRDLYRGAGYKNVVIGDPEIEVRASNRERQPRASQKRQLFITIPIEEGERWKLGEVTIEGNEIYTDEFLLRAFEHAPAAGCAQGDRRRRQGDQDALPQHRLHLRPRRRRAGGARRPASPTSWFTIDEGDQFRVGRIEFQGNDRTKDKVLRRELRVQEGLVFNIGAAQATASSRSTSSATSSSTRRTRSRSTSTPRRRRST